MDSSTHFLIIDTEQNQERKHSQHARGHCHIHSASLLLLLYPQISFACLCGLCIKRTICVAAGGCAPYYSCCVLYIVLLCWFVLTYDVVLYGYSRSYLLVIPELMVIWVISSWGACEKHCCGHFSSDAHPGHLVRVYTCKCECLIKFYGAEMFSLDAEKWVSRVILSLHTHTNSMT